MRFILAFVLFYSASVFAENCSNDLLAEPAPALSDQEITRISTQMAEALRPRVKFLDRDLIVFHYDPKSENFNIRSMDDVKHWIYDKPGRFTDSIVPEPLYVATDPLVSRDYGWTLKRDAPWLTVLQIKAGTPVLDEYTPFSESEIAAFNKILNLGASSSSNAHMKNVLDVLFQTRIDERSIRKVFNEIELRLKISASAYEFRDREVEGCREGSHAIAIRDRSSFTIVGFYSDHLRLEETPMAANIARLYRNTDDHWNRNKFALPQALTQIADPGDAEYRKWLSEFIMYCGPKWSIE